MQTCRAMWKKLLPILLVPLMLTGCATVFTNLTPTRQPRNANNLYPVEVQFDSRQQALRWDSIQAYVLVGSDAYPMRKVPNLPNRWEALVPVPAGAEMVNYRYKFDYLFNEFGGPQTDSRSSLRYELHVLDK